MTRLLSLLLSIASVAVVVVVAQPPFSGGLPIKLMPCTAPQFQAWDFTGQSASVVQAFQWFSTFQWNNRED